MADVIEAAIDSTTTEHKGLGKHHKMMLQGFGN
jgi:hypothetical protein